jgi:signal transduction histidine kinase
MDYIHLIHIFVLTTYLLVGAIMLYRGSKRPHYSAFALLTAALAIHASGSLIRYAASSESLARSGTFLLQTSLALLAPASFIFTSRYLELRGFIWMTISRLLWANVAIVVVAGLLDLYAGMQLIVTLNKGNNGWQPTVYGPVGYMLAIVLIISLIFCVLLLLIGYRKSVGLKKVQFKLYGIGFTIASAGGILAIFFKDASFTPIGATVCFLFIAYAITRYQFLDFKVVIRLGFVYVLVSIILLGIYAGLAAAGTTLFGRYLSPESWTFPLLGIASVALLFNPIHRRVQDIIDRTFFRQEINIREALESFSISIGSLTRIADLQWSLAGTLVPALQPGSIQLFVRAKSNEPSTPKEFRSLPVMDVDTGKESPAQCDDLVAWLETQRRPCVREELMWGMEQGGGELNKKDMSQTGCILDYYNRWGIDLVLPLHGESELLGMLALGPKRAQIPYRTGEIAFASAIAAQTTLVLQNIWLNESARELEKKAHDADKLATVGALASEIAHEVRNPLTIVKTYIRLLPEKGKDAEFIGRFQSRVEPELNRVEGILNNVLQNASKRRAISAELKLDDVASATLDFFSEEFANRRITAEKDWNGAIPTLQGDPDRLRQVFQNLIQNAMQAMPGGGTIRIRIRPDDDRVRVEISDTGHGIPAASLPTLFKPFTSEKPGGTGLGLVISKQIIMEHGGTIGVKSQTGEGTTFTIDLPLKRQ